jgi:uncharacterized protein YndB with AHSA1/START domain
MKDKRLTIIIDKSVGELFTFTTDPKNTPKWIDGIALEETNEMPPKLGTIYRNKSKGGNWNEYEMTAFVKDKMFGLSRINGNYHVRYTFTPKGEGQCEFEYYEWVDEGELDDTFSQEVLEKLKSIVEQI